MVEDVTVRQLCPQCPPASRQCPKNVSVVVDNVGMKFQLERRMLVALDGVNLTIGRGEFLAVLGPSGCGKSTLLRTLAALDMPSSGTVSIDGRPPADLVRAHRLGIAFQDHALLPWLSVLDNLALPFRIAGLPVDLECIAAMVKMLELNGFEKARPSQLSGGMRQRASIGRALMLEPTLLLLDEPFGALDAVTRRKMHVHLQRVWTKLAVTTLLVTHDVHEALLLADRVAVMSGRPGRVIAEVAIPLPRPRTPDVQRSQLFHELADRLTAALDVDADTGDVEQIG
jgi:NitT/TauT family transport system ATP-binding protein